MSLALDLLFAAATIAAPVSKDGQSPFWAGPGYWDRRHEAKLREIAKGPKEYDFVFIGDSITHNWEGWSDLRDVEAVKRAYADGKLKFANAPGRKVWDEMKREFSLLNLGCGGDSTQNVLWRLEHGELDGYRTKGVALTIGTNNTEPPWEVADGVRSIVRTILEKQPQAKVILMPIFPSGPTRTDPNRVRKDAVSWRVRSMADGERIIWLDFNRDFLEEDGTLSAATMPDFLHLLEPGYRLWRAAIEPVMRRIVRSSCFRLDAQKPMADAPTSLMTERLVSPIGIDILRPRLSWKLPEGFSRQAAYEIDADCWQSGKVECADFIDVQWGGPALGSSQRVTWRVRVWSEDGRVSAWSAPQTFVMGVVKPGDWKAKWIGPCREARPDVGFGNAKWVEGSTNRLTFVRGVNAGGALELVWGATRPHSVFVNGKRVFMSDGQLFDFRRLNFLDISSAAREGLNEVVFDMTKPPTYFAIREIAGPEPVAVLAQVREGDSPLVVSGQGEGAVCRLGCARDPAFAREIDFREERASSAFGKVFPIAKEVRSATLHVTGLGFHEVWLNGRKVGDKVLDPPPTDYDRRVLYSTHLLDGELRQGDNRIEILLGHGWWDVRSRAVWNFDAAPWRSFPRAVAQLEICYADGTRESVVTDESWRHVANPVAYDCIREGEVCNGNADSPVANRPAEIVAPPRGALRCAAIPGAKVTRIIRPSEIVACGEREALIVFGENVSGWARIRFRGLSAGDEVLVRYDENVAPGNVPAKSTAGVEWGKFGPEHRMIDINFLNSASQRFARRPGAFQTDHYVAAGSEVETYEPRFTYNGFRAILVSGLRQPLRTEDVEGLFVRTAFPETGDFSCSDETLNRLVAMARESYAANFTDGFPTDCPHREKLGWTGDGWCASALGLTYFENTAGCEKWLRDIVDTQRPDGMICSIAPTSGWGYQRYNGPTFDLALPSVAWDLWTYRGDQTALETAYEPLLRLMCHLRGKRDQDGLLDCGLGDWNGLEKSHAPSLRYAVSCAYLHMLKLAAGIAAVRGRAETAKQFGEEADAVRRAIRRCYYKGEGIFDNGGQTAQALAVNLALAEKAEQSAVAAGLVASVLKTDCHIDVGLLGSRHLYRALGAIGRADLAYRLLVNPTTPSMVPWLKEGTTLHEDFGIGLSKCHVMLGDFAAWTMECLVGIRPKGESALIADADAAGYAKAVVEPHPVPGMDWAKGHVETPRGRLAASWRREKGRFVLDVVIPPAAEVEVRLPSGRREHPCSGRHRFVEAGLEKSNNTKLTCPVKQVCS